MGPDPRRVQPKTDIDETRLLVVDVRKGSVILELLPALAPLVATVEYANAAIEFVKHLSSAAAALRRPGGRIEGATTQQLKNLNNMVVMVAKDSRGSLDIAARYQNGQVLQELVIKREDARVIAENA